MRARLRATPAWAIVLAAGVGAALIRLGSGPPDESALATVLLVALLLALVGALVVRGTGDGWGIFGVMLIVNYGLQVVDRPVGVEAFVYVCLTTSVVWLLFDRHARRSPLSQIRSSATGVPREAEPGRPRAP